MKLNLELGNFWAYAYFLFTFDIADSFNFFLNATISFFFMYEYINACEICIIYSIIDLRRIFISLLEYLLISILLILIRKKSVMSLAQ